MNFGFVILCFGILFLMFFVFLHGSFLCECLGPKFLNLRISGVHPGFQMFNCWEACWAKCFNSLKKQFKHRFHGVVCVWWCRVSSVAHLLFSFVFFAVLLGLLFRLVLLFLSSPFLGGAVVPAFFLN